MRQYRGLRQWALIALAVLALLSPWSGEHLAHQAQAATAACNAISAAPLLPKNPAACQALATKMARPSALPLNEYEETVNAFLGQYCHRDAAAGWVRDKRLRDTGPFTATLADGAWSGQYFGTHAPVVVWYSPSAFDWIKTTRPPGSEAKADDPPPPDGAIMVKEMFPAPAAACAGIEPEYLRPSGGAAFFVRDSQASHDGWFAGWYGFPDLAGKSTFVNDWPAAPGNAYPNMGFGQYCSNCHASATNSLTFASLRNIQGQPGKPLVYLSQNFFQGPAPKLHHSATGDTSQSPKTVGPPAAALFNPHFLKTFGSKRFAMPADPNTLNLPSQTYDNVWVKAGPANAANQFVTSDQCLGCHDAGSTGLQFDMTRPVVAKAGQPGLVNESPYGGWSSSPMGLAGRDPVFFAQLASEVQTFHPANADTVQGVCFGCHGVQGARQYAIDQRAAGKTDCAPFQREMVNAVPYPPGNPGAKHANFGALARDGIACLSCHRTVFGEAAQGQIDKPENACIAERQALLNPDNRGFARSFTGSFLVGPPAAVLGPFAEPKAHPMRNALNLEPKNHPAIRSAEVCGSCHTVHLPVFHQGKLVARVYEQTTYPEWAFSAYRTGISASGEPLPYGPGARAESCQSCHMPSKDSAGKPLVSKIASIQEYSNFPETDHNLGPQEIDLTPRQGFAKHTLVGLNYFLVKMAAEFPAIFGIRTQDPMLGSRGVPPLQETQNQILAQAANATVEIKLSKLALSTSSLQASVSLRNLTGHKFPSGVGFRRAFVEFRVLDGQGKSIWVSGRTDDSGQLVNAQGLPLAGERWWTPECKRVDDPSKRAHQPHYQVITRQDQAQIYQELVSTPPAQGPIQCGPGATPAGELTTSFLSICAKVKDNRILPDGFLPLPARIEIARALGAGADLAEDSGSTVDDPDYRAGGSDTLVYKVPLADLKGVKPAAVQALVYYQATPPYFLQDRFCTASGPDPQRLFYLAGKLDLSNTPAAQWKLRLVQTPVVKLP